MEVKNNKMNVSLMVDQTRNYIGTEQGFSVVAAVVVTGVFLLIVQSMRIGGFKKRIKMSQGIINTMASKLKRYE